MKQQFDEVKYPCRNCIYFKACGETTRTEPCDGRMTKSEKKKEINPMQFVGEFARNMVIHETQKETI